MNHLNSSATALAAVMVEHALKHGARELDTAFIGKEAAKLALAIDSELREQCGEDYEKGLITMHNIDEAIAQQVIKAHALIHKANAE